MNNFYRTLRFLLSGVIKLFMNLRVVNKHNQPKKNDGPFIICANHISALDPIAIAVTLKHIQPHYLGKQQLFKNKFLAWFFGKLGMIPVNRSGNDVGALKTTINLLKEGKSIGIFPQGTRHPGEDPRDTKVRHGIGMIQSYTNASVLPIYIKTKDNKAKLFRKTVIILGDVITAEEIGKVGKGSAEYERISNLVFDRICTLGEEYEKNCREKE